MKAVEKDPAERQETEKTKSTRRKIPDPRIDESLDGGISFP